jgi:hypothetical protein
MKALLTPFRFLARSARGVALLALVLGSTTPVAQKLEYLTPDQRVRLEAAEQRLNLSTEQRTQVYALLNEEADRLRALDAQHQDDTSRAQRRDLFREGREVQQEFRGRLAKILTANQLAEWDRIRQEAIPELRKQLQAKKGAAPGTSTKP